MKKFTLIAGIDISKDTLDVQWRSTDGSAPAPVQKLANSAKGIHSLFNQLIEIEQDPQKILICCEHTGVYMDKLWVCMQSFQCVFWPVHPMIIRNYLVDMSRIKSDKADAGKILEFAFNHQYRAVHFNHKSWHVSQLRDLFRAKKQLIRMHVQIVNFKHAHKQQVYGSSIVSAVYEQIADILVQYIRQCEKEIKVMIKQSPTMYGIYQTLVSIPGIGPVTAVHLIAVCDCFEKIDNYKSFACFIGIAPFEHSSGTTVRKRTRTSKKAYNPLKADMYMGATSIIRPGQLFHEYYNYMISLNKHHNWIINAIINKIAKIAFHLIAKHQIFNKNTYIANKNSWKNNLDMS
jgi:transposase